MSQGEQTVLRYQYIMQATADAQGDFARTSDGYANSLRLLETNIETLKTRLGTAIIPIVSNFVAGINDMMEAMQGDLPEETILDKFAAIDTKTADKIAEIEKTADSARATAAILDEITGKTYATESLVNTVATFSASIGVLDSAMETAKKGDYGGTMQAVADALSKSSDLSADDWETILTGTAKAVNEFDADSSKVSWPLALTRSAIEAEPSKIGLENAKSDLESALSGIAGINTGEAEKTISSIDDAIKEEPTVGVVSAPPKIEGAIAQITELDTDGISGKIEEIGQKLGTTIEDTPPVITILDEIKSKTEEEIDTGTLESNVGKISTAVTKAPPDQQGTIIQVLEGIPDALRDANMSISVNGDAIDWLGKAAEIANSLGADKAAAWQAFVDSVGGEAVSGMLSSWAEASTAVSNMAAASNALGGFDGATGEGIGLVAQNLKEMGIEVTSTEQAMALWEGMMGSLISQIPSLGDIVNVTTGEIKGGTAAVYDAIDAWQEYQEQVAMQQAFAEKRSLLEDDSIIREAQMAVLLAQVRVDAAKSAVDALNIQAGELANADKAVNNPSLAQLITGPSEREKEIVSTYAAYQEALVELSDAQENLTSQTDAWNKAMAETEAAEESAGNRAAELADELGYLTGEQEASAKAALEAIAPALEAMADMYESTRESIRNSVENMFDGFDFKMPELKKGEAPTADSMQKSLEDQLEYMKEYMRLQEELRGKGLSADVLGSLSSGSTEDYAYLKALADAPEKIAEINKAYEDAKQKREEFVDSLTATTLEGDDEWNQLQSQVNDALGALNTALADTTAVTEAENIVSGILNALKKCTTDMSTEIDAIIAQWARLEGVGLRGFSPNSGAGGADNGQPHAGGLDYVPFNGYLARLHEGESVLTREQSREWRSYSQGAQNASALDYAALGGVIRDNAPKAGGNVYLDGSAVGRVISDRQADSYRMLERSGWQG